MRRLLLSIGAVLAFAGLAAGSSGAKLSPVEQRWVTPLLKVYNAEAAALAVVQQEERASGALVAGSGKNNTLLTETLAAFTGCSSAVRAAGAPPSTRLQPFESDLASSCARLGAGGSDIGKAIGQIRAADVSRARSLLETSLSELVAGSKLLAAAERQLMAVGGKSEFEA